MHRTRWARTIGGFLDGELDSYRREHLLRHLDRCPDCLSDLQLMAWIQTSLTRLARV